VGYYDKKYCAGFYERAITDDTTAQTFRMNTEEVYVTQEDDRLIITPKTETVPSVDPELAALVRQAEIKWAAYHSNPKQREEIYALRGCLKDSAIYDGLDGVAYQHKVRDEWEDSQ
jgi:virulence-associated protein VagC